MTPAEQAAEKLETPFSVRRRVSEMDALRARIRSQSKAVAAHIAADSEAQAFLDDWAAPEPLNR